MNSYQCYQCNNKCCNYKVMPYTKNFPIQYQKNKDIKIRKAGSFIYNNNSKKVLLVQSRGQMWGSPKGSLKDFEEPLECAIREVKEETGIDLDKRIIKFYSNKLKSPILFSSNG